MALSVRFSEKKEKEGSTEQSPQFNENIAKGIIAVVLLGVLLVGVSSVPRWVEAGKTGKAKAVLSRIRQAEKTYQGVNGAFVACANNKEVVSKLSSYLAEGMDDIANDSDWNYAVNTTQTQPPGLTMTATRAGSTKNANETITLTHDNMWGGNFTP